MLTAAQSGLTDLQLLTSRSGQGVSSAERGRSRGRASSQRASRPFSAAAAGLFPAVVLQALEARLSSWAACELLPPVWHQVLVAPWGTWDLSSTTRDRTRIPCIGRWILNPGRWEGPTLHLYLGAGLGCKQYHEAHRLQAKALGSLLQKYSNQGPHRLTPEDSRSVYTDRSQRPRPLPVRSLPEGPRLGQGRGRKGTGQVPEGLRARAKWPRP